jgi:antimicrobial peptide system SdpB family protein
MRRLTVPAVLRPGAEWSAVQGAIGHRAARGSAAIATRSPFGRPLALARTALATSLLLTFAFTPSGSLFLRSAQYPDGVVCDAALAHLTLFCAGGGATPVTIGITVAVGLAVLSGVVPALTAVPHWWVAWSLNLASPIRDGGDQVAAVVTLLLVPLLLCDRRRNHWQVDAHWQDRRWWLRAIVWAALVLVWVQASVLYANAAIAKFTVAEWANGTALWYWIQEPSFRPPGLFVWLVELVHTTLFGSVAVNYGVLLLELAAATLLVTSASVRRVALPALLAFHLLIAVVFGLWSFFFSMAALLFLYLRVPRTTDERSRP